MPLVQFNAPILTDLRTAAHQKQPDSAGALHVRSAAGLEIGAFDLDGAQDSAAVHFLAYPNLRKLFRSAVSHGYGTIFEDHPVHGALCTLADCVGRLGTVEIDRGDFAAEMKRDGGQSEALLKNRGEEVLPGVLLHVVEAAVPIDAALDGSEFERTIEHVHDLVSFVAHVEDFCCSKEPQIMRLAARGWIEQRAVQYDAPSGSQQRAINHYRLAAQ